MNMIRFLTLTALGVLIALSMIIPQAGWNALAADPLQIGPGFQLPNSSVKSDSAGKYPGVATKDNTVHIVANPNQQARYWTKSDTDSGIGEATDLGSTNGKTDYANATVATAPDGTVYAFWVVQSSRIAFKTKAPGTTSWSSVGTARRSGAFISGLDVAITSSGVIFVTWNEDFAYRYIYSTNGGRDWSSSSKVTNVTPYRLLRMASGPNGSLLAAFGSSNGLIYAAYWNGSGFTTEQVTPSKGSNDFFAEPGASVAPNGTMYVTWRNANGGIYYGERKSDGSWGRSRIASAVAFGTVGISADANNNLHLFWTSNASGKWDMWYAFQGFGGDWQGPVRAPIGASILANARGATTIGARAYGHAVFEQFDGNNAWVRYQQFSGNTNVYPDATPVLEGGAQFTKNSSLVLSFTGVKNSPDSVRYHWGSAPTNADSWVSFATSIAVAAPAGISADSCQAQKLYVQLRKGSLVNPDVRSTSITFDTGIQAGVELFNPNMQGIPAPTLASTSVPGASNGDATYTRDLFVYLHINGNQDCGQLASYTLSGHTTDTATHNISNNEVGTDIPIIVGSGPGDRTINVKVTDRLGNSRTDAFTLTYDPSDTDPNTAGDNLAGLPVLVTTMNPTVTVDLENSSVRQLTFENISVNDSLYGVKYSLPNGKRFWGVYIATTTSPNVTVNDPSLKWAAVHVPVPSETFDITWNVFTGLGYTSNFGDHPGDYYIYVRFLDGAGNISQGYLKQKITLDPGYTFPIVNMPTILK